MISFKFSFWCLCFCPYRERLRGLVTLAHELRGLMCTEKGQAKKLNQEQTVEDFTGSQRNVQTGEYNYREAAQQPLRCLAT